MRDSIQAENSETGSHRRGYSGTRMHSEPLIGLICDHNSPVLAGDIMRAGYRVIRVMAEDLEPQSAAEVDVWVVDCVNSASVAEATLWLEPRILAISNRPDPADLRAYRRWCERILEVLERWTANLRLNRVDGELSRPSAFTDVKAVWVLAGSTGAFHAVRRFLARFSEKPPVAFILALHIDPGQESTLMAIAGANPHIHCEIALGRHWLNPGQLLIVPASSQLAFKQKGEVYSTRQPWSTRETPSIDGLMLAISGLRPRGAIMFSGAGKDGSKGMEALANLGTTIWVQDPGTCEAPSMPESVIGRRIATGVDTPEALAERLEALYAT